MDYDYAPGFYSEKQIDYFDALGFNHYIISNRINGLQNRFFRKSV